MTLRIDESAQGSDGWLRARLGVPTASCFKAILTPPKSKGGEAKTRLTYLRELAGERLTGLPGSTFTNEDMERGTEMEPAARALYVLHTDNTVVEVGFCFDDELRAGASPDGFVGEDGTIEIKTKKPALQLAVLDEDEVPSEHIAQIQGGLWITGRKWCDFVSYWPGLPLFIKRVERDEEYITRLAEAVATFNEELDQKVQKYQPKEATTA